MKKILIGLIIFVMFSGTAFCQDALYRISSGEIWAIGDGLSVHNSFFAIKTGAVYLDGTNCMDTKGDLKVLGISKILDGDNIRNSTQGEIDSFAGFATEDRKIQEMNKAIKSFQTNSKERRVLIAILKRIIKELNILRNLHSLPDRNISQLKTAIEAEFDKDD